MPLNFLSIDVNRILLDFGGITKLKKDLEENGVQMSRKAFEKWRERGTISMDGWLKLMALADVQGKNLRLETYITTKEVVQ